MAGEGPSMFQALHSLPVFVSKVVPTSQSCGPVPGGAPSCHTCSVPTPVSPLPHAPERFLIFPPGFPLCFPAFNLSEGLDTHRPPPTYIRAGPRPGQLCSKSATQHLAPRFLQVMDSGQSWRNRKGPVLLRPALGSLTQTPTSPKYRGQAGHGP